MIERRRFIGVLLGGAAGSLAVASSPALILTLGDVITSAPAATPMSADITLVFTDASYLFRDVPGTFADGAFRFGDVRFETPRPMTLARYEVVVKVGEKKFYAWNEAKPVALFSGDEFNLATSLTITEA